MYLYSGWDLKYTSSYLNYFTVTLTVNNLHRRRRFLQVCFGRKKKTQIKLLNLQQWSKLTISSTQNTNPSRLDKLPPEILRRVVESEFLASDVVDGRLTFKMQEEIILKQYLLWFLFVLEVHLDGHEETCVAYLGHLKGGLLDDWWSKKRIIEEFELQI